MKFMTWLLSALSKCVLRIVFWPLRLLGLSLRRSAGDSAICSSQCSFDVPSIALWNGRVTGTLVGILALILIALPAFSQVPVSVGPEPQTQFLDMTGAPLAGGIVCTYQAGSSTPLATYIDFSGSVQNSNPIVLDAAGRANIWWQAQAYKVVLAGGGTCASPSNLQWAVDGFSVGLFAAGNNTFSGNNTFNGTSTFNGPVNIVNGGSLNGSFSGNPNFSGVVTFSGSLSVSQLTLTVATGTPPLVVTSTTAVPNLNVEIINGVAYPASPPLHSVPIITATNTATYKVITDCAAANEFLNFTQSTNAFSCGAVVFPTIGRLIVAGTALMTSDFVISGSFGVGASMTVSGVDSAFDMTVTAGSSGVSSDPTVTLTFADGAWTSAPHCVVSRGDVVAPNALYWGTESTSTTQAVFGLINPAGSPTVNNVYKATVVCVGTN